MAEKEEKKPPPKPKTGSKGVKKRAIMDVDTITEQVPPTHKPPKPPKKE